MLRSVPAALVYTFFQSSSRHAYSGFFRETSFGNFFIHPGSALFGIGSSRWLVAAEVVRTSKDYLRCCTKVEVAWLRELIPHRFTEEIRLDRFSEDRRSVIVIKTIMFKNLGLKTKVGEEEATISLEDAKKIQDQQIQDARKNGWELLTFVRQVSSMFGVISPYLETGDGTYRTWSYDSSEVGVPYFCQVERFMDRNYARPKLKVLDIGLVETPKVSASEKPAVRPVAEPKEPSGEAPVSQSALAGLATNWGARKFTPSSSRK